MLPYKRDPVPHLAVYILDQIEGVILHGEGSPLLGFRHLVGRPFEVRDPTNGGETQEQSQEVLERCI